MIGAIEVVLVLILELVKFIKKGLLLLKIIFKVIFLRVWPILGLSGWFLLSEICRNGLPGRFLLSGICKNGLLGWFLLSGICKNGLFSTLRRVTDF